MKKPVKLQTSKALMMVSPDHFSFNPQTASSNAFQKKPAEIAVEARAKKEFKALVAQLRKAGIEVIDFAQKLKLSDAVFPNNWISFHRDGKVVLYPMMAENRRAERSLGWREEIEASGFAIGELLDLSHHENQGRFLEGTGSVVFDHQARLAFACHSPRTNEAVLRELCAFLDYKPVVFSATDPFGKAIYHTNVVMSIGVDFAVICEAAIKDQAQRKSTIKRLELAGKEIVSINEEQMHNFAANILQMCSASGELFTVMSSRAYNSFGEKQLNTLKNHTKIIHSPLECIENVGGGSARCMLAEIHLPKKD